MPKSYFPNFTYSNSIIGFIENISKIQGELEITAQNIQDELEIISLANIDAVHFSTKLEGNTLTYQEVTQALTGHLKKLSQQRDLKEILNYSKARKFLQDKSLKQAQLNKQMVLDIHKILMDKIVVGKLKGNYRKAQNVIKDAGSGKIVYLPPTAEDVNSLMEALLAWVHKAKLEKLNPLICAAIFHYYFVTIHPFLDGNGRAARLLTNYILSANNYPISKYAALEKQHENNRQLYYKALRQLQAHTFYDIPEKIDLTPWIEYWLNCLLKTYEEAIQRVSQKELPEKLSFLDSRLQKAYSLFKKHKQLKSAEYEILMGLKRTQSVADLNKLTEQGFIKKIGKGRSQIYRLAKD